MSKALNVNTWLVKPQNSVVMVKRAVSSYHSNCHFYSDKWHTFILKACSNFLYTPASLFVIDAQSSALSRLALLLSDRLFQRGSGIIGSALLCLSGSDLWSPDIHRHACFKDLLSLFIDQDGLRWIHLLQTLPVRAQHPLRCEYPQQHVPYGSLYWRLDQQTQCFIHHVWVQ